MALKPAQSAVPLPASRAALATHQSHYKRIAVENARRSKFFKGKLDHISLDRLDEPEEWAKIPVLDKDMLRDIPEDRFFDDFCIAGRADIQEFWRSGGSTGRPLFYPRTFGDIRHSMAAFARSFEMMAVTPDDIVHNSFPLGIHPAGHMWARAALEHRLGMNWAGSGAGTPSAMQLALLKLMQPSVWIGMPSYGLHLTNLAETEGIDLTAQQVRKILTSAEPLSNAKRARIEREWDAKIFNSFGMTEISLMGSETTHHDGIVMWTDIALIEVLDPDTYEPVPEGEQGTLVSTSLMTNNATPFLRWNSGDIVSYHSEHADTGPYAVFPMIRHAHRTMGFFKVRGVNINHAEFEDLMLSEPKIADFKLDALNEGGVDILKLTLEIARDVDEARARDEIGALVKSVFEVSPEIEFVPRGTIAREFEQSIKAYRFADRRE